MDKELIFKGDVFNGALDLSVTQFVCIPSKPVYAAVDLCLRANGAKGPNIVVAEIDNNSLSFNEKQKLGYEIQKRWNAHERLVAFAKDAFRVAFEGGTLDGSDIQELGVQLGLLDVTEYDPQAHGPCEHGSQKGDTWYTLSEIV